MRVELHVFKTTNAKINLLNFINFSFFPAPVYEEQTALEVYDDGEYFVGVKLSFPRVELKC